MDKIIWLGQAGFLFEYNGCKIMIDPYLTDSVKKYEPKNYRRVAVDESFFKLTPDVMIFTHDHLDHYDTETVERFITDKSSITVLSPKSVWEKVRKIGGNNNFIEFNRHTVWSECGLTFTAVKAVHSESFAIGVIIDDGDKKYYITGDTLYNTEIFEDIPNDIYALFLPINGVGNNMNMTDAKAFSKRINPQKTVPVHFGLFDSINPEDFDCDNKVIPEFFKEIKI